MIRYDKTCGGIGADGAMGIESLKKLWEENKPGFIGVIGGFVAALYLGYKAFIQKLDRPAPPNPMDYYKLYQIYYMHEEVPTFLTWR